MDRSMDGMDGRWIDVDHWVHEWVNKWMSGMMREDDEGDVDEGDDDEGVYIVRAMMRWWWWWW